MNLRDTAEQAAFRQEAKGWLAANAPSFVMPERLRTSSPTKNLDAARRWAKHKFDCGYAGIDVPTSFGGRGLGIVEHVIFQEEESLYNLPTSSAVTSQNEHLITCFQMFDHPLAQRLIPAMLSGDETWCQMFSEPDAGSDVAAVRTSAVRDGDKFIVNGQKTWNSGAHFADWAFLVARSNPDVAKHKGLSCFILDMKTPGITVRPIPQMHGLPGFNEVFLDDVVIPAENVVGEPDKGWEVMIRALVGERKSMASLPAFVDDPLDELVSIAEKLDWADGKAIDDPAVRERIATWAYRGDGAQLYFKHLLTRHVHGFPLGPEASLIKLVLASRQTDIARYMYDLLELDAMLPGESAMANLPRVRDEMVYGIGYRSAGGTDEILRNLIGEHVLQLPGEPRPDKTVAFSGSRKAG